MVIGSGFRLIFTTFT